MNFRKRAIPLLVSPILFAAAARPATAGKAGDWPRWRGPTGNGISPDR